MPKVCRGGDFKLITVLDGISMYRLMLSFLLVLIVYAAVVSFLGILPYSGWDILIAAVYAATICRFSNELLAKIFKASANIESSIITGFILTLILGPADFRHIFLPLTLACLLAMTSKYLLAWKGRHIFNPAAVGAVVSYLVLGYGASWWVGSLATLPVILLGGVLVLRKLKRFSLVTVFFTISLLVGGNFDLMTILVSPIFFFDSVMLIEPITSPYKFKHQLLYAILVALAFNLYGFWRVAIPLELALLTGNIFAYLGSGSFRKVLTLADKKEETKDIASFIFRVPDPDSIRVKFEAGQYLEWTLLHKNPDNRGVRRFFTIASSPTEDQIMIASRFTDKSSSFKAALKQMREGEKIVSSNLAGEFTLPQDLTKKLAFIAGGIGITPFRSMAKYLLDKNQERDIILLYSNKTKEDIVFRDIFDAVKRMGWKTIYINTETEGLLDEEKIKRQVPDYKERIFYLSGPQLMVDAFKDMLINMGIDRFHIKTDFFPGYS